MHLVLGLLLIRDQLVTGRDGDVNPHPERIARMLRAIRVLDHDVAPADVIAEAIEARGLAADKFVELVRFFDPPVRDSNG